MSDRRGKRKIARLLDGDIPPPEPPGGDGGTAGGITLAVATAEAQP